ncbi:hypothetical protein [Anaerophilus nitritogenes]|uniref:hypothetical protein n=1 Tax=Anaerophilus nitritogenes TaxID=2498136 RepID=UPI00101DB32D|nr:hypothetical protein [Anaerophilus nitritogenes]
MKKLLKIEFTHCINSRSFKFVFSTLLFISLSGYLINCYEFYGNKLSFIRSAFEYSIIQGVYSRFLMETELFLLPILACIIYSDSYFMDAKLGTYKNIITRVNKKNYIIAKGIIVFIVTFFTFFIPLMLNQLLCFIAFPIQGYDNNYAIMPYDIGFQNYTKEFLFDLLRLQSPFLYNMTYMIIISLCAALFALLGYSIYFIYKKNRMSVIVGIFALYNGSIFILSLADLEKYSIINYLRPTLPGSIIILLFWMIALFIVSTIIITKKGFHDEIGIED